MVRADFLSHIDAAGAGNAKAHDAAEVTNHSGNGIGCHHIRAHVPHDDGVHGKANTPDDIISKCGQGQADEILHQNAAFLEHGAQADFDIGGCGGYSEAGEKLNHAGCRGGKRHAPDAHFRAAEPSEHKHGVQEDVQQQGAYIQGGAGLHPLNAA